MAGGVSDHDRAPQAVRCTLGQPRGATHAAHSVLASGSLQRPLGSPTTAPPTLHHPRAVLPSVCLRRRLDETVDTSFYSQPRMIHHIDEEARRALQAHYRAVL